MSTPTAEAPTPVIPSWDFADRLRKARDHANMNQAQLAAALGINKGLIGKYEARQGKPRDLPDFCVRVEEATGVSAIWLAGLDDVARISRQATRNHHQPLLAKWQRGPRGRPDQRRHRYAVNARALRRHADRMDVADIRRKAWRAHLSSISLADCTDQIVSERTIPACKDDTVRLAQETTRTTAS